MKQVLIFLFCLIVNIGIAQPTYFGVTSVPADNAGNTSATNSIVPPASMVKGDLVVVIGFCATTGATWSVTADAGQNWGNLGSASSTTIGLTYFWCRFSGTWSGNPQFTASTNGVTNSLQLVVFRPTNSDHTWEVNTLRASTNYAAPVSPFTVTRTGIASTTHDNTVVLALFHSRDDNTWLENSGIFIETAAQYRNTGGTQQSTVVTYLIQATAGAGTGDPSWNQATLGGDSGVTTLLSFRQVPVTNKGMPLFMLGN